MIEDGRDLGLMLAFRHLLGRLEAKGMMSYPETQHMVDHALGDVKRLRIEDKLTQKVAADTTRMIGELYHRIEARAASLWLASAARSGA
jgi:hypothetical protein